MARNERNRENDILNRLLESGVYLKRVNTGLLPVNRST